MQVTYIHHSSFLVELPTAYLLFDYTEGGLPELTPDKDLFVFASHRHGDHFSPVIFTLAAQHPHVRYILSDDIWQNQVPEERGCLTEFIDPGITRTLLLSDGTAMAVHAYKSTDEGVAFAVRVGGHTIYHAGDLNDWRWNGESKAWNGSMHANYMRELQNMQADGVRPDIAMVPVDGRLEEWFYLGLDEFMSTIGAAHVFPMHFWGDFSVIRRLKELPCTATYRDRIADIGACGQVFPIN